MGPLKNEGNEMTQAFLTIDRMVVPRRSVTKLSVSEINNESERLKRVRFDEAIYNIHGIVLPYVTTLHTYHITSVRAST